LQNLLGRGIGLIHFLILHINFCGLTNLGIGKNFGIRLLAAHLLEDLRLFHGIFEFIICTISSRSKRCDDTPNRQPNLETAFLHKLKPPAKKVLHKHPQ